MDQGTIDRKFGQLHAKFWQLSWPLLLLCLLAGSRWLLEEALPSARSTTLSAGVGCSISAMLVWAWNKAQAPGRETTGRTFSRSASWTLPIAAALLVTSPALSGTISDRHVSANAATITLALTPVVCAVALAAINDREELAGLLWPGLAGLAGLLLLLPEPSLSSWRADVALATMPLLSGVLAVYLSWVRRGLEKSEESTEQFSGSWLAMGLLLAAPVFGLMLLPTFLTHSLVEFSGCASAADGLTFWLTLVTLKQLGASRWSAQFILTPFVTVVEGIILLRPTLTVQSWIGLLLLLLGGSYLLLPRSDN